MFDSTLEVHQKSEIFLQVQKYLTDAGIQIASFDDQKPWGGFFVIHPSDTTHFIEHFFTGVKIDDMDPEILLSPKILIVQPGRRLSWQYHYRRSELWTVADGEVGVIVSDTDSVGELQVLKKGSMIRLQQGERHRLVGLDRWAVIAEIWQHTDPLHPSDEEDIVRLQDDYGR